MSCRFCNNVTVDPSLNYANDLSYNGIGVCLSGTNMFIRSGNGMATSIIITQFDDSKDANVTIGVYDMRFCPECGRKLTENRVGCK